MTNDTHPLRAQDHKALTTHTNATNSSRDEQSLEHQPHRWIAGDISDRAQEAANVSFVSDFADQVAGAAAAGSSRRGYKGLGSTGWNDVSPHFSPTKAPFCAGAETPS
jgi:hypothetical protein